MLGLLMSKTCDHVYSNAMRFVHSFSFSVFMFGCLFSIYFDFLILSNDCAILFFHISLIHFHICIHSRRQTNTYAFLHRLARTQTHLEFHSINCICAEFAHFYAFRMTYTHTHIWHILESTAFPQPRTRE